MTNPIEISCACDVCGGELESIVKINKSRYNRLTLDVTPCPACERLRNQNAATPSKDSSVQNQVPKRHMRKRRKKLELQVLSSPDTIREQTKRKRGRPRKVKASELGVDEQNAATTEIVQKRRRGRPPKNASPAGLQMPAENGITIQPKRRGRPPKNRIETA